MAQRETLPVLTHVIGTYCEWEEIDGAGFFVCDFIPSDQFALHLPICAKLLVDYEHDLLIPQDELGIDIAELSIIATLKAAGAIT